MKQCSSVFNHRQMETKRLKQYLRIYLRINLGHFFEHVLNTGKFKLYWEFDSAFAA